MYSVYVHVWFWRLGQVTAIPLSTVADVLCTLLCVRARLQFGHFHGLSPNGLRRHGHFSFLPTISVK